MLTIPVGISIITFHGGLQSTLVVEAMSGTEMKPPEWFSQAKGKGTRGAEGPVEAAKGSGGGQAGKKGRNGNKGLLEAVAKLLLIVTREFGDVRACVFVNWTAPTAAGFVQTMIMAGKKYDEYSKELRKDAENGVEFDYKKRGDKPKDVQEALVEVLERTNNVVSKFPLSELGEVVKMRCAKAQKKTEASEPKSTIFPNLDRHTELGRLVATLGIVIAAEGGKMLTGPAPRGPLEREVVQG
ncbi:unnamed protein product [Prorocentrum cordatum]|uniref:Uncharacterized protein n=1 Tax=Prorocentrum cordatum TaxID=2364126 RepID=A0ABN9VKC0_9DINO|nr:unnamed protein product [Polarella glacialis]